MAVFLFVSLIAKIAHAAPSQLPTVTLRSKTDVTAAIPTTSTVSRNVSHGEKF